MQLQAQVASFLGATATVQALWVDSLCFPDSLGHASDSLQHTEVTTNGGLAVASPQPTTSQHRATSFRYMIRQVPPHFGEKWEAQWGYRLVHSLKI